MRMFGIDYLESYAWMDWFVQNGHASTIQQSPMEEVDMNIKQCSRGDVQVFGEYASSGRWSYYSGYNHRTPRNNRP